ncbi:phosphomannomutase/phosphoglucomutase [Microbulbifer sp. TYP-18]|uniref:phosphomannomutase/phosphoglucomutase n=1 Tax=Microbulbifer sp. TYP-18 TaxID=3230024 RepID=UPI0034C6A7CE
MTPPNKDRPLSPFHQGLALPALLACIVWLGGAFFIAREVVTPRGIATVDTAAQALVDRHAGQLGQILHRRAQDLRKLPGSEFRSVALEGSPAMPTNATAQFFAVADIRVGAGAGPQLNFALVDLLKRGLDGSDQRVEFLRTGDDDGWQLHQVVATDQGALLVTEDLVSFAADLPAFDSALGGLVLTQQFDGGPPQSLWRSGGGDRVRGSAKVTGSYLKLGFSPSAQFVSEQGSSSRWVYLGALVGLVITLVLLVRYLPRNISAPWRQRDNRKSPGSISREPPEEADGDEAAVFAAAAPPAPRAGQQSEADTPAPESLAAPEFPPHVFRAYDIRGIAGAEIDEPFAYQLGVALGTLAQHAGEKILLVGRDGRNSSALLANCLNEGILDSGCNSVDLGMVPSPLLYYACAKGKNTSSGVVVTASHNPAEYNGFKILLRGRPLSGQKLQQLHKLMRQGPFKKGRGSHREQDVSADYIDEICNGVALAGQPRLVVDAGNGATSVLAPQLFQQLGCAVTPLFCSVDGDFPNHAPDPSRPENLRALTDKVKEAGADLGVALDGDGDRVTLITASGLIAWPDQLVMLLARDVLVRNPGADIVFDVKSSRALGELVSQYGGRPVMWKTGHAPMKTKILETGAVLGGELSGHIFIVDRWFGFDDGIYAAARILEIMALREQSLDELLDSLPQLASTPEILLPVKEEEKFALVERLRETGDFPGADINTLDGLRIEYADGWGLVRASNTGAALTLRFEAESDAALQSIRSRIMGQLKKVVPDLSASA